MLLAHSGFVHCPLTTSPRVRLGKASLCVVTTQRELLKHVQPWGQQVVMYAVGSQG
jgi:hypothetical protein